MEDVIVRVSEIGIVHLRTACRCELIAVDTGNRAAKIHDACEGRCRRFKGALLWAQHPRKKERSERQRIEWFFQGATQP